MAKLVVFVFFDLKVEDVLRIAARTANKVRKNGEKNFAEDSAIDFKTLKFEGAFGHHSFYRNIEKAYSKYTIDMDEVTPSLIWALDNIKGSMYPELEHFILID